mgnify:FL=1
MDEKTIKEYADLLCQRYGPVHPLLIAKRERQIILELMRKFNINYEDVEKYFRNNKDR